MSTVKLLTSVDGAPAGALLHRDLVYLRQLVAENKATWDLSNGFDWPKASDLSAFGPYDSVAQLEAAYPAANYPNGIGIVAINGAKQMHFSSNGKWSAVVGANYNPLTGGVEIYVAGEGVTGLFAGGRSVSAGSAYDYSVDEARLSDMSNGAITVPTYVAADNEVVHPSVVYLAAPVSGYRYWMACTPYSNSDSATENPEIYASNDGKNWSVPPGGANPIVAPLGGSDFNSDPYLTVDERDNGLLLVFRQTIGASNLIKYMRSMDGITWSAPELMLSTVTTTENLISPSVIYDKASAAYTLLCNDGNLAGKKIVRSTASSLAGPWSARVAAAYDLPAGETSFWHCDFRVVPSGKIVGLCQSGTNAGGSIYAAESTDGGVTFAFSKRLLTRSASPSCYKSGFIPFANAWLCYFGFLAAPSRGIELGTVTFDRSIFSAAQSAVNSVTGLTALPVLGGFVTFDSFNRADDAANIGSPTFGTAWTVETGTLGISSNRIYKPGAPQAKAYIASGISDIEMSADNTVIGDGGYLTFRRIDASNFWRVLTTVGAVILEKIESGIVTWSTARTWTSAAGARVKVIAVGSAIKILINDVLVISIKSATHVTGTGHGIQITGAASANMFDNFLLKAA